VYNTLKGLELTIQSNRTLGQIAAVFSLLGIVSTIASVFDYGYLNAAATPTVSSLGFALLSGFFGLLAFIGFILFMIAMYGFSRDYGEHRIFNYLLYGFIATIVAAVIAGIAAFIFLLGNIFQNIPSTGASPTPSPSDITSSVLGGMSPFMALFSLVSLIWIIANVLAFRLLADKSGVPLFRSAAFVLLAGAVINVTMLAVFATFVFFGSIDYNTYILAGVPGALIQDVAWILLFIAYRRIQVTPPTQPYTFAATPPSPIMQTRVCPNCGATNPMDSTFCTHCGQKI